MRLGPQASRQAGVYATTFRGTAIGADERHLQVFAGMLASACAETTWRAYGDRWRHFETFCTTHGLRPLPASLSTVAQWLIYEFDRGRINHPRFYVTAINRVHRDLGLRPPGDMALVSQAVRGFTRYREVHPGCLPDGPRLALGLLPPPLPRSPRRHGKGSAFPLPVVIQWLTLGCTTGKHKLALRCAAMLCAVTCLTRASTLVNIHREDVRILPEGVTIVMRFMKGQARGLPPHQVTFPRVPVGVVAADGSPPCHTPYHLICRAYQIRRQQGARRRAPLFFPGRSDASLNRNPSAAVTHYMHYVADAAATPTPAGDRWVPHSARHCARIALSTGCQEIAVQDLGGWVGTHAVARYKTRAPPATPEAFLLYGFLLRGAHRTQMLREPLRLPPPVASPPVSPHQA